jgi:hypothetical protein
LNWRKYFEVLGPKIGLYHVEVPAPSLEEVTRANFNPFRYCREWVLENVPERINEPWYPPYHLLYPFPTESSQELFYHCHRPRVEYFIDGHEMEGGTYKSQRYLQFYAHYELGSAGIRATIKTWLQWLKFGNYSRAVIFNVWTGRVVELRVPDKFMEAIKNAWDEMKALQVRFPALYNELYTDKELEKELELYVEKFIQAQKEKQRRAIEFAAQQQTLT